MKETFFNKNRDLMNVLVYLALGTMIIVGVVAVFMFLTNNINSTTYYDSVAGVEVDGANTGSISDNLVAVVGLENISESGIDANIDGKSTEILRQFVTVAYPEATKLSYKKDGVLVEGQIYKYEVVTDSGVNLFVEVEDYGNGDFAVKVSDSRNELLNYASANYSSGTKNSRSFGKNLPKTFTEEDLVFSVVELKNGNYQINLDSCGDEEKKKKALEIVNKWATSLGYDSSELKFLIPNLCDGSV